VKIATARTLKVKRNLLMCILLLGVELNCCDKQFYRIEMKPGSFG
jgi:hypothetical protein